jgi:hypothetical protein
MAYIGVPPFGQTVRTVTEITATAGQTVFAPSGGYIPAYIDVYLNGVLLNNADFAAPNGVNVTLTSAASASDEFKSIAYFPVELVAPGSSLPSQTGNAGKYLTTDGTDPSWATLDTDANSTTKGLYEMANTISANYSITSGNNAMSAGPITINSGISVTIPSGSRWAIV